jgi:hypothetical protein
MQGGLVGSFIWVVTIVVVAILFARQRRRRRRVGAGGAGTLYDWLNDDKRRAVDIVVEERAASRDPEDRNGNLPELEDPRRSKD